MKRVNIALVLFLLTPLYWAAATNLYVSVAGTNNTLPFTNWSLSCSNIQWVVNASANGDVIYITNGHYYLTNYVNVNKGITLSSFNNGIVDPTNTIIDANCYNGAAATCYRCMNINDINAVVVGLTLTNGSTPAGDAGGGCKIDSGLITNCIIAGNCATNSSTDRGGGVYIVGASSVAANCRIIRNVVNSTGYGGGISCGSGALVKDCFIGWNSDTAKGAGIYIQQNCNVYNCTIVSNWGMSDGGGALYFIRTNAVVSNCTIINNTGRGVYQPNSWMGTPFNWNLVTHCSIIGNTNAATGAGLKIQEGMTVRNCLIANNVSSADGAGVYIDSGVTGYVQSCTVVSNYSKSTCGGIVFDGTAVGAVSNTIVCSNIGIQAGSYDIDVYSYPGSTNRFYNSCCKTVTLPPAQGNIQSDPSFVDFPNGNFRLSRGSPCINAGANQNWMANSIDMDWHHRLDRFSGLVDMGCYEFVPHGTMFRVR